MGILSLPLLCKRPASTISHRLFIKHHKFVDCFLSISKKKTHKNNIYRLSFQTKVRYFLKNIYILYPIWHCSNVFIFHIICGLCMKWENVYPGLVKNVRHAITKSNIFSFLTCSFFTFFSLLCGKKIWFSVHVKMSRAYKQGMM